jgi:hypothetical protein
VEAVLRFRDEVERLQGRIARLERQVQEEVQKVHKQYRRELVLYDSSKLPAPRR